MKVPYSWLREYCDPGLPVEELADRIAMRSAEVERVSRLGPPDPDGFVVGKVLSAGPHPDADRLSVCEVDTGDGSRTIVCGAPNVAGGQTVPGRPARGGDAGRREARQGEAARRRIRRNDPLRGGAGDRRRRRRNRRPRRRQPPRRPRTRSRGGGGQFPRRGPRLPRCCRSPSRCWSWRSTRTARVDCFGVYGVAREVHAFSGAPLAPAPWEEDAEATGEGEASEHASVTVEVPELCPRFTARVFSEVKIGPSPLWLKARLIAAGQRPINNIVDITNYVMLLTAQPLHAFDLAKVPDGALIVRTAEEGETMRTLDGVERRFDSDAVLVCDRNGPAGIAGIMGGEVSEVSETTTSVLLEVATWNGVNILRTSRRLGLRSEASNRFEKQLHPELAIRAQRIASRLIVELCGAKLHPGTIDAAAEVPPAHRLSLRTERADRLLGMRVEPELCETYLERLGFEVSRRDE